MKVVLIGVLVVMVFYVATFKPGLFALACLFGAIYLTIQDLDKRKR